MTPEQTNQPVTDRPDDLIRDARNWTPHRFDTYKAEVLITELADALEAAQKEIDGAYRVGVEAENHVRSQLIATEARVRQLEEALAGTVGALGLWESAYGEINVWPPACRKALAAAREVLAAKENTTP